MTRALSFDVWLTLIRSNPRFKAARDEVLRRALTPTVGSDEFRVALRAADVDADRSSERSGHDVGFAQRVTMTCTRLGRDDVVLADDEVAALLARQHELALELPPVLLDASLPEVLHGLAPSYTLAITSNTGMLPGATMRALLDEVGVLAPFSVHTFSDEVGYAKPHEEIFAVTLRGLRDVVGPLDAHDVVHLGDNPVADEAGARAAGLHAVLVGKERPVVQAIKSATQATAATTATTATTAAAARAGA